MIMRGNVNNLVRKINLREVFLAIVKYQPVSRVELAEICGLSRSTITVCIDRLLDEGLVESGETEERSRKGRPKEYLRVCADAGVLAAIHKDQSGEITGMVTDLCGKVLERFARVTDREKLSAEAYTELVAEILREIREKYRFCPRGLLGAGIDQSCIMDPESGIVEYDASEPEWCGFSLKKALQQKNTGVPLYLLRPAAAAGLGEIAFGSLEKYESCVFLVGSWGLGTAYYQNDVREIDPMPMSAGFSHTVIRENGRQCVCGNRGCLEAYATIRSLYEISFPGEGYDPGKVEWLLREKDKDGSLTQARVREMWDCFAIGVLNAVNTFRPDAVVIGGREERFLSPGDLERIRAYVYGHMLERGRKQPDILVSGLKEEAPLFGSIAIARRGLVEAVCFPEEGIPVRVY